MKNKLTMKSTYATWKKPRKDLKILWRTVEEMTKRFILLSVAVCFTMITIVYLTNEFYLKYGINDNAWMPYYTWILMAFGFIWVFIPLIKLRRLKTMPYDITDAMADIQRLELVCRELQEKVFPERFKDENKPEEKKEEKKAQ